MDANAPPPITLTSAAGGYLATMLRHGWMILTFRHHGEGLDAISNRHLTILAALGLMAMWYLPSITRGAELPSLGMVAIGLASFAIGRIQFGAATATGFALLMLITEPAAALMRLAAGEVGAQIDYGLRIWCLAANLLYVLRCSRRAKRGK